MSHAVLRISNPNKYVFHNINYIDEHHSYDCFFHLSQEKLFELVQEFTELLHDSNILSNQNNKLFNKYDVNIISTDYIENKYNVSFNNSFHPVEKFFTALIILIHRVSKKHRDYKDMMTNSSLFKTIIEYAFFVRNIKYGLGNMYIYFLFIIAFHTFNTHISTLLIIQDVYDLEYVDSDYPNVVFDRYKRKNRKNIVYSLGSWRDMKYFYNFLSNITLYTYKLNNNKENPEWFSTRDLIELELKHFITDMTLNQLIYEHKNRDVFTNCAKWAPREKSHFNNFYKHLITQYVKYCIGDSSYGDDPTLNLSKIFRVSRTIEHIDDSQYLLPMKSIRKVPNKMKKSFRILLSSLTRRNPTMEYYMCNNDLAGMLVDNNQNIKNSKKITNGSLYKYNILSKEWMGKYINLILKNKNYTGYDIFNRKFLLNLMATNLTSYCKSFCSQDITYDFKTKTEKIMDKRMDNIKKHNKSILNLRKKNIQNKNSNNSKNNIQTIISDLNNNLQILENDTKNEIVDVINTIRKLYGAIPQHIINEKIETNSPNKYPIMNGELKPLKFLYNHTYHKNKVFDNFIIKRVFKHILKTIDFKSYDADVLQCYYSIFKLNFSNSNQLNKKIENILSTDTENILFFDISDKSFIQNKNMYINNLIRIMYLVMYHNCRRLVVYSSTYTWCCFNELFDMYKKKSINQSMLFYFIITEINSIFKKNKLLYSNRYLIEKELMKEIDNITEIQRNVETAKTEQIPVYKRLKINFIHFGNNERPKCLQLNMKNIKYNMYHYKELFNNVKHSYQVRCDNNYNNEIDSKLVDLYLKRFSDYV